MIDVLDVVSQIFINILGLSGVYFLSKKNKWGMPISFFVQFFWYLTFILNKQWILLIPTTVYAVLYAKGWYQWFKPE